MVAGPVSGVVSTRAGPVSGVSRSVPGVSRVAGLSGNVTGVSLITGVSGLPRAVPGVAGLPRVAVVGVVPGAVDPVGESSTGAGVGRASVL